MHCYKEPKIRVELISPLIEANSNALQNTFPLFRDSIHFINGSVAKKKKALRIFTTTQKVARF